MKFKPILLLAITAVVIAASLCVKAVFFKKPVNVLLITMDTTRADRIGCYGYDKNTTPNVDSLAAEGVVFNSVVAPVPYTFPSHLSIMTGTLPIYHGAHTNDGKTIPDSTITLAELLKEQGYQTGAILASYVLNAKFGLDQGFDHYQEHTDRSKGPTEFANGRRASETAQLAVEWIQENKEDKFFLFAHFYDPHFPYHPPEPFASTFGDPYDGEVASMDHAIGRILHQLKELELYDNTLIIVASDHGELLGEHDEAGHGYFIYEGAIKVPLIIKQPGAHEPQTVNDTVGLIDLAPTVCSLLGIQIPDVVQGADLSPYFQGKEIDEERYQYAESLTPTKFGANSLLGVVGDSYKYIQTTRPELYDVGKDPAEANNLVNEDPKRARFMQGHLKDILDTYAKAPDEEGSDKPDLDTKQQLESLGYIGGEVDASLSFDQTKPDPKDLLYQYNMLRNAMNSMVLKDWENAELWRDKLLAEKPALGDLQSLSVKIWLAKVQSEPDKAKAYEEIANQFYHLKEYERALNNWNKVLALEVDTAELRKKMAAAHLNLNHNEEALTQLSKSLEFDPDQADVHFMLGNAYNGLGKKDQAFESWTHSLTIDPNQPKLHDTLAKAYYTDGKIDKIIFHWTEVVRLQPDNTDILNNLAWLHAAAQDPAIHNPPLALEYASRACELTDSKQANYVDTLAVAYAADGQFPLAVETAQKALELALTDGTENLVDEINRRLQLYKTNKPYYDKNILINK